MHFLVQDNQVDRNYIVWEKGFIVAVVAVAAAAFPRWGRVTDPSEWKEWFDIKIMCNGGAKGWPVMAFATICCFLAIPVIWGKHTFKQFFFKRKAYFLQMIRVASLHTYLVVAILDTDMEIRKELLFCLVVDTYQNGSWYLTNCSLSCSQQVQTFINATWNSWSLMWQPNF